MVSPLMSGAED